MTIESGSSVLSAVEKFLSRFCVFPDEYCLTAVTLWAAHTHMAHHFYSTPRLALLSPEPGSGKTRVLEVLDLVVLKSMFAFNASPAAIFRTLEKGLVTLLLDEVDTIWGAKRKDDRHEDLRALLNAGYKRGAAIPRCVGPSHDVKFFEAFCPVAVAGIGNLPDTIKSRSLIVKMRRRAPVERIEPFRSRVHAPEGTLIREGLADWADATGESIGSAWPTMPYGIEDRNAEIWEPLLAVADAAGGGWPNKARMACVAIVKSSENEDSSLGLRLLADLRVIFLQSKREKLSTAYLLDQLKSPHAGLDDDAPWDDLYGHGASPRIIAKLLKPYGIRSKKVRMEKETLQGYCWDDLYDAFQRYLPSIAPDNAEHAEQVENAEGMQRDLAGKNAPDVPVVPDVPENRHGDSQFDTAVVRI